MAEPGGKQAHTTTCGIAEADVEQQLIPGIPNEITLGHITSKLSRRDIHNTFLIVSRGWRHAIRSRQVYDARVRSNSTETFILFNMGRTVHPPPGTTVFADCDSPDNEMTLVGLTKQGSTFQLPRIPSNCFDAAIIPGWGRCATLDGRVFVFGGLDCKVHVLDVAAHGQWKQCANMLKPKEDFGCGVIDGKIYVFGAAVNHEYMYGSEAYNPKENTWSTIRPIVDLQSCHCIAKVRREFFERNGQDFYGRPNRHRRCHMLPADLLEVYDPLKDDWTAVEPVGSPKEKLFVAGGKFYSMSPLGMDVYDFHENSWVRQHSFSCAAFARADPVEIWPMAMLTDDGELLAVWDWPTADNRTNRLCLMQTRGLRSQDNEIVWQKADFSIPLGKDSKGSAVYVDENNTMKL